MILFQAVNGHQVSRVFTKDALQGSYRMRKVTDIKNVQLVVVNLAIPAANEDEVLGVRPGEAFERFRDCRNSIRIERPRAFGAK